MICYRRIVSGYIVGESECGNVHCHRWRDLQSLEVNFAYTEQGKQKQTLVGIRLCPECHIELKQKRRHTSAEENTEKLQGEQSCVDSSAETRRDKMDRKSRRRRNRSRSKSPRKQSEQDKVHYRENKHPRRT